jgi:hypothetical protein
MKSISKKGKIFTGKFAETAVRVGIAKPVETEIIEPEIKRKVKKGKTKK